MFEAEAVEARAIIDRAVRCPDRAAVALVLAWESWAKRPDLPVRVHAYWGVRRALAGRDLAGVGSGGRDALNHTVQGAGMGELADRRPGPVQQVMAREAVALLAEVVRDEREAELVELFSDGRPNKEVAAELNVTQGRTTQMRQALRDRLAERLG